VREKDLKIIYYKIRMNISNIIEQLFNKYNEPYDSVEPIEISNENKLDFKKIIMDLKDVEKTCKENKIPFDLKFNPSIKVKNIAEINFVDDLNLAESIIEYRKLVIRHIILINNYNVVTYNALLLAELELTYQRDNDKKNISETDISKIREDKERSKKYLEAILIKSGQFYDETLCRYKDINDRLGILMSNKK